MRRLYNTFILSHLIIVLSSLSFVNLSIGQGLNFDKIITPEGVRPLTFKDYLVQLAWLNSQEGDKHKMRMAIAKKEVEIARRDWMDEVQAGFNINEVSFDNVLNPDVDNIVIYPLYQFTATVSLGTLFNNRKKREVKELEVTLEELEARQKMLNIRREVLSRYQKLLLAREVLKARTLAEDDAKNSRDFATESFKTGDISLEDLTRTSESYYNALEKRMDAEAQIELAIIELEELIGIDWEVAERMRNRMGN